MQTACGDQTLFFKSRQEDNKSNFDMELLKATPNVPVVQTSGKSVLVRIFFAVSRMLHGTELHLTAVCHQSVCVC